MQPFTFHTGTAAPMRISDVDTDQIIPARYCASVTKEGLADALFADWRSDDPDFVLNHAPFSDATVLVAGENFGSGSSREWAVWALQDYGIRAVIAPRYGDIFKGNALKNGLLVVELPAEEVGHIWKMIDDDPEAELTVDLLHRVVKIAGAEYPFHLDDDTAWRLINGFDDIALTLEHQGDIDSYESRRRTTLPTLAPQPSAGVRR
ncbi:MAG: 3-isopropylmalate dehydratase small subunit [Mycobacterium sp.]|nr:3-isopropylmalate dehydratase small subunit [Mycobacterium sp.]